MRPTALWTTGHAVPPHIKPGTWPAVPRPTGHGACRPVEERERQTRSCRNWSHPTSAATGKHVTCTGRKQGASCWWRVLWGAKSLPSGNAPRFPWALRAQCINNEGICSFIGYDASLEHSYSRVFTRCSLIHRTFSDTFHDYRTCSNSHRIYALGHTH